MPTQFAQVVRWLIFAALTTSLSGCLTSAAVKTATGENAKLTFVLVDGATPRPRVYWRESPLHAETLLTLNVALPDCDQVRLFVNPQRRQIRELSAEPISVRPMVLNTETEITALHQWLPDEPCTAVLFAGEIKSSEFRGIAVDDASMRCRTYAQDICADIEGDPASYFFLPFAVLMDGVETMIGVYPLMAAGYSYKKSQEWSKKPFTDTVQVNILLADGRELSFAADYTKAKNILEGASFELTGAAYAPMDLVPPEWETLSFWVRAAIVDAGIDFRLQQLNATPRGLDDITEVPWPELHVTSLDGHTGTWTFEGVANRDLNQAIGGVRTIRVRLLHPPE